MPGIKALEDLTILLKEILKMSSAWTEFGFLAFYLLVLVTMIA